MGSENQHQVFGNFLGNLKVSDSKITEIKHMIGFAENAKNR